MPSPGLILGTAQINTRYGFTRQSLSTVTENEFEDLLNGASELGINALDTASAYPGAHALIKQSSWDGPVHTKISNLNNAHEELERAKTELGRDSLELVYFHDSSVAINNPQKARTVARDFLANGVLEMGVSVYSADEFEAALELPEISVIQVPLNPLDQRFAHHRLVKAWQSGKKVIARSIFLQGLLLSPPDESEDRRPPGLAPHLDRFFDACTQARVSPLLACLDFILQTPHIFGFIVGLENLEQGRDLIATLDLVGKAEKMSPNYETLRVEDESLIDPRRWG